MKLSLVLVAALALAGCDLFTRSARPAAAGVELATCDQTAGTTWAEYTPCCLDVAKRYPLADGGPRDTSACFAPDGGK